MDEFEIIGWPECQALLDKEDFEEYSTLIEPNENLGIDCSTYLVSKEWLNKLKNKDNE